MEKEGTILIVAAAAGLYLYSKLKSTGSFVPLTPLSPAKKFDPLTPLSPATPYKKPFGLLPTVGSCYGKTTRPDTTAAPDVYNPCPNWPFKWRYIAPNSVNGWPSCGAVFGPNFQPTTVGNGTYTGCSYKGEGIVTFIKTNSFN